jgi:hypothetical protein
LLRLDDLMPSYTNAGAPERSPPSRNTIIGSEIIRA